MAAPTLEYLPELSTPPAMRRQLRRRRVEQLAARQGGVVSRRQLYAAGVNRWEARAEIRARRWLRIGRQTVRIPDGQEKQVAPLGSWFRALFEVQADAALDGVSALQAAGLRGFVDGVHVSVSKGTRYRKPRGVVVHETRRRRASDVLLDAGPARVAPAVAAVRAALWARSNRQASLVLVMAVQQRLVEPAELWAAVQSIRRDRRRALIRQVVRDALDGAESLGELDFARMCRAAGLPMPERQSVRQLPGRRAFLDAEWVRYGVSVEIDGSHHGNPDALVADAIRQNEVTIQRTRMLRIPLLGLRVAPDQYLDQIRRALRAAGWGDGAVE